MAKIIFVAGKGGTGKTTFASLVLRYLVEKGKGTILAVDADPNANLNEALGVEVKGNIADILDEVKDGRSVPPGMTKDLFVEYKLQQVMTETPRIDLLVMGGPQGPGCYCYANDLLRGYLERLAVNYDYLVVDSEAGLEHLSRRTVPKADVLFVLSDASARGLRAAARVKEITDTLKTPINAKYLVVTKTLDGQAEALQPEIEATSLPLAGFIPLDSQVMQADLNGRAIFYLPEDAVAVRAVTGIAEKTKL
ncbi:MAG: carbon monoxide dehydrogenase [Clostridia bacterium]|nr:MAG: carbon monoxide dehydrogenase [Clostridia bacterium]